MARRFAYLTPDNDETQTIVSRCLSVPLPLLPHVVGALSELTNVWQWEQFGTMTPEDASQLATVMLNDFSGDCGMNCEQLLLCLAQSPLNSTIPDDALLRVVDGQPQYSYDGTNWLDVYGDAAADPIGRPLTATSGTDSDARICLAATRAMLVIAETYKGVYGAVTADIYNTSNRFANWLNNFNRWLSGIVWPDAAWITQSELLRSNALPENYTAGELTTEAKEDLLCLLVEYATDNAGIVTFDWGAIRDNTIATLGINPGTAIWSIIVYLKNRGIEIASTTPITDTAWNCATCSSCVSYVDNMEGSAGLQTFELPYNGILNGWEEAVRAGYWVSSAGYTGTGIWVSEVVSNGSHNEAGLVVDLGRECTVTSAGFWTRNSANGYARTRSITYYGADLTERRDISSTALSSTTWQQYTESVQVAAVRYVRMYNDTTIQANARIDDVHVTVL